MEKSIYLFLIRHGQSETNASKHPQKNLLFPKKFKLERIFEDHENIVEAMSNWSRDSENQIIFTEKDAKYDLFLRPEVT